MTEVMVFGPSIAGVVDLNNLKQLRKPEIVNLGLKVDPELKLESQIRSIVRSSFFSLKSTGQN